MKWSVSVLLNNRAEKNWRKLLCQKISYATYFAVNDTTELF